MVTRRNRCKCILSLLDVQLVHLALRPVFRSELTQSRMLLKLTRRILDFRYWVPPVGPPPLAPPPAAPQAATAPPMSKTSSAGSSTLTNRMSDMSLGGKDKKKLDDGTAKKKGLFGKMKW